MLGDVGKVKIARERERERERETTQEANKPMLIVIDVINKLIKKPFNCSNIA